ncbi:putative lipid-binding protein AIR1 [Vigna radiata var. radiata]|uniref:Lipid-binding protein AIR1 n=1 Tax=Vigna radiata var. radiata TaxID=3916 RepID=A0A1S3T7Z8_VIGRR|nr:putative lipid-binding protein AIR1 [Vigna radiata var. radiata]
MGSSQYLGLLLLSLSLVSVSVVRSQTCPNLSACVSVLNVVNVTVGVLPDPSCCSVFPGLSSSQAEICLRNAITTESAVAPLLGIVNLNATISTMIRSCNVTVGA